MTHCEPVHTLKDNRLTGYVVFPIDLNEFCIVIDESWHDVHPDPVYPGAHNEHVDDVLEHDACPGQLHDVHAVEPVPDVYVPAAHDVHAVEPVPDVYVPAAQGTQDEL